MARHRRSSLNGRGIADFDELIIKNSHITLRSCVIAFCFDPTTLIEIAVNTTGHSSQFTRAHSLGSFKFVFLRLYSLKRSKVSWAQL